MRGPLRDDLALAAYAVSLGFELRGHLDAPLAATHFADDGIPPNSLQFTIGDVHVWATQRGWRMSQLVDGVFARPTDSDFYLKLKQALDEGARHWRDR